MESFKVFLSHKYSASLINEFFFRLFSENTEIHFEVDEGKTSTNVTRLERMVRNADAFIGIYPFEIGTDVAPNLENLREGSKYFRLELDLALRAQKPVLVFADARYKSVLSNPYSITYETFVAAEIVSAGGKPSAARFAQAFESFRDRVVAAKRFGVSESRFTKVTNDVAVMLPIGEGQRSYNKHQIQFLQDHISDAGFEPIVLEWPPILNPRSIGQLRTFDWAIIDVGPETMSTGVVGYLHGASIPTMRLLNLRGSIYDHAAPSLYAGVNVGYQKDIIRWSDTSSLENEFAQRLASLNLGTRWISTLQHAVSYFHEATLRKEIVFISYSGEDEALSQDLRDSLRKRFQQVFDYRDGKSISPGQPWISQIFDQLGRSAIGVPILSSNYLKSGYCLHELRQIVSLADGGKLRVLPIKLRKGDDFQLPSEIQSTQYARSWEYESADKLTEWVVANISAGPNHL